MLRSAGLLAVAVAIASCSIAMPTSAPPTGSGPSSPPPTQAPPTAEGPLDTPPPLDPEVIGLTCGTGPAFHPALLEGPSHAENEGDAAAAALREFVSSPESGVPSTGWTRVAELADYVQFVAPGRFESGWAILAFTKRGGGWELAAAGQCRLGPNVPSGVSVAVWHLDAAFARPGPDERSIHVLLTEQACASAQSPEGRILQPQIVGRPDSVTITILVRNVPGGADCPGNPEFAMPIELPEALAQRPLFDGSFFPPFGPIEAYALDCGPMERDACIAFARQAAADAERKRPGHRIVRVAIFGADGDSELYFEDGTRIAGTVD